MDSRFSNDKELNQVLYEAKQRVRIITLNRPQHLNSLTLDMIYQMKQSLEGYERDPEIKLIVIKGQGKAFSAGGDVTRLVQFLLTGDVIYTTDFYMKQLMLDFLIATYKKPIVFLINGVVMGGGAGLSLNGKFRIVTENTVFAMPEVSIGLFPDVGVSYFLSRLSGSFGEYLGLTGRKISGAEMVACGLGTHFVLSKDIESLENELYKVVNDDNGTILDTISKFVSTPNLTKDSPYERLNIIKKCFSKKTIEEILLTLEHEEKNNKDKWIPDAVRSIKLASPTSLKLCLKIIRESRDKTLEECLSRDYKIGCRIVFRKVNSDFYEGVRATFLDKDKKPKWVPQSLEDVNDEMIEQLFLEDNDPHPDKLKLPERHIVNTRSKL